MVKQGNRNSLASLKLINLSVDNMITTCYNIGIVKKGTKTAMTEWEKILQHAKKEAKRLTSNK
jgi:hypothetical protein